VKGGREFLCELSDKGDPKAMLRVVIVFEVTQWRHALAGFKVVGAHHDYVATCLLALR
jgi:hypothetical protein